MKYYLLLNGEVKGPFPLAMVREMLHAGAIQDTSLIAQEGANGWKPAGQFLSDHPNDASDTTDASVSGGAERPLNQPKWFASRNHRIAVALILAFGIWLSRGGSEKPKEEATVTNEKSTETFQKSPEREYRSATYGTQSSMRSQVQQLLARRYSGDSGLQYEIELGVMKLYEIYPNLSAAQLIQKFESIANGY